MNNTSIFTSVTDISDWDIPNVRIARPKKIHPTTTKDVMMALTGAIIFMLVFITSGGRF